MNGWRGLGVTAFVLALAPAGLPPYVMTLLTEALILGLFAMSLDLMVGYTRLLSFGHAAAYGLGAYTAGNLLLHTDLHPQNVILTGTGPVIIDWEAASFGPAIIDVALTWVIVGYSEIPPGPRIQAAVMWTFQAAFTRSFVRAAGPLDESWQQTAIRLRLADPNVLPTEAVRLERMAAAFAGGLLTGRPSLTGRPPRPQW